MLPTGAAAPRHSVCAPMAMAFSLYRRLPYTTLTEAAMSLKTLQELLNQKFRRARRPRKVRQRMRRTIPQLEPLEQRLVPSIAWANQGDVNGRGDSDGFDAKFGSNAAITRRDVLAAIDEWNHVITNFNYPGLPMGGYDFRLNLQMESMGWDPFAGGALADGAPTSNDAAGIPTVGSVDINSDVPQWYLDPTPYDNGKFPGLVNPFDATWPSMPSSPGADLVQVTLHEVCHAVGFVQNQTSVLNLG
jgi:hypothetical protein